MLYNNIQIRIKYAAMRDKIIKKLLRDVGKTSILKQSKIIGVPYATLHRIVNGKQSTGNIKTWEKIENYYAEKGRAQSGR
jgi:predicted transcriptional regulator